MQSSDFSVPWGFLLLIQFKEVVLRAGQSAQHTEKQEREKERGEGKGGGQQSILMKNQNSPKAKLQGQGKPTALGAAVLGQHQPSAGTKGQA